MTRMNLLRAAPTQVFFGLVSLFLGNWLLKYKCLRGYAHIEATCKREYSICRAGVEMNLASIVLIAIHLFWPFTCKALSCYIKSVIRGNFLVAFRFNMLLHGFGYNELCLELMEIFKKVTSGIKTSSSKQKH